MTPEQAQAIYFAGEQAVVTQLCELGAQVTALRQQNETLQRQIAKLPKNSSNSSKRPSSDDITKPKGGKKTQAGDTKGHQIGIDIDPAGSIVVYFSNQAIFIPVILGCLILESFPKAAP